MSDQGRPRSRRRDVERNLRHIVQTATSILVQRPEASMAEIAEASGLVRATLYRHFPTREDLLTEIHRTALADAGAAMRAAEPERGPAPEALRRMIGELLAVGERYRIVVARRIDSPELLAWAEEIAAPLLELVARGQREGTLRDDLPTRWLAASFGALITVAGLAESRGELDREGAARAVAATLLEPVAGG